MLHEECEQLVSCIWRGRGELLASPPLVPGRRRPAGLALHRRREDGLGSHRVLGGASGKSLIDDVVGRVEPEDLLAGVGGGGGQGGGVGGDEGEGGGRLALSALGVDGLVGQADVRGHLGEVEGTKVAAKETRHEAVEGVGDRLGGLLNETKKLSINSGSNGTPQ